MAKHLQLTDELQEKATLYAAGALPESERREYQRHLDEDDCSVCRKEVLEMQSAASLLALDGRLETPSPRAKERLMEQARAGSPVRQKSRWAAWTAAIAGLTAVTACTMLAIVLRDNSELRRLASSLSSRVSQLEAQISEQRVKLATMTSPQIRIISLSGQTTTPQATGRIFWDQSKRRWLFYAADLPPVSS